MLNPIAIAKKIDAPRKEDAPVFKTPWEARVFALTALMADQEKLVWDDFRDALIVAIAEGDELHALCDDVHGTPYYRAWLAATEKVLQEGDYCLADELSARINQLSSAHSPGKLSPTGTTAKPVAEE